jgi:hypothetical protein
MTDSPILDVVRDELHKIKQLADKSIAQVDDQQLWDAGLRVQQHRDPDASHGR